MSTRVSSNTTILYIICLNAQTYSSYASLDEALMVFHNKRNSDKALWSLIKRTTIVTAEDITQVGEIINEPDEDILL